MNTPIPAVHAALIPGSFLRFRITRDGLAF
jgi:hypothetical protein